MNTTVTNIVQQMPQLMKNAGSHQELSLLKLLNTSLKVEEEFEQTFDVLCEVELVSITNPRARMYGSYLVAKGYKERYKRDGNPEDLYFAVEAIKNTFSIAHEHNIPVRNAKYLFSRAHAFFLMAKREGQVDETYYRKAYFALRNAYAKYSSSSFMWLKGELQAFANDNGLTFTPFTEA
ncbi:MAG: hypothetical protein Crog4KO_19160 [Crocinitomicaceae bacterium]